jgi:hypothetical protein
MTDTDYNVAVDVFFQPYVLCEVPSNLLLAKFSRPSYYMGTLVICWGLVMTFTGVVQSFGALVATRFLLGIFEYDLPSTIFRYAANVANLLQSRILPRCDLNRQPVVSTILDAESNGHVLRLECSVWRIFWSSCSWDSSNGWPRGLRRLAVDVTNQLLLLFGPKC